MLGPDARILLEQLRALLAHHHRRDARVDRGQEGEDRAVGAGERVTVIETDEFGPVGVSICFDGDFPEVARSMRREGARIVLHPSAYETEATTWWETLYPANALANGQWWIMANQAGTNPSGSLLGGSRVISPFGEVIAGATVVRAGLPRR